MHIRLALYELAVRHRLYSASLRHLQQLAGLDAEPAGLSGWLPRGVAILAAALAGLGIIFWIAANWETFGRSGRFALLQAAFLIMCVGALWRPAVRTPLGLLAFLATGAIFAYFGQTYQTGADPWQLFALWAVLTLPLCLGARSDAVWTPWVLVVMVGMSLWVHAHAGYRWSVHPSDLGIHLIAWGAALAVVLLLGPLMRRWTGAGRWALRMALMLLTVLVTTTALAGLFQSVIATHYWLALPMLAVVATVLSLPKSFDLFGLSAVGLSLNVLIVAGVSRAVFDGRHGDLIGELMIVGLVAAGLLAATVSLLLRLVRRARHRGWVA